MDGLEVSHAHDELVLLPDQHLAEVKAGLLELVAELAACLVRVRHVHDSARLQHGEQAGERASQQVSELSLGHLVVGDGAGGRASAADRLVHAPVLFSQVHVVRRVSEARVRQLALHQALNVIHAGAVAAGNPVRAADPDIARN